MKLSLLLISMMSLIACVDHREKTHALPEKIISDISALMLEQERSWNNADLEGFMKYYWNNDSLVFVGSRGPTYGWTNTLTNYRKSYPDQDAMGKLRFTNIKFDVLNDENVYVIGKWELFRSEDTLAGHYSLLWKNISGKWLIVADHSS